MRFTRFENACIFVILMGIIYIVRGQDSCFQRPDPGVCRASIPRFYFDSRSGRCDNFLYGGCGGNRNNFESFNECQQFRNFCLRRRGF